MPTHTQIKASAVSRDHTEIAYWTSGDGHIVNRWRALSSAGVVRSWSVVFAPLPWHARELPNPRPGARKVNVSYLRHAPRCHAKLTSVGPNHGPRAGGSLRRKE